MMQLRIEDRPTHRGQTIIVLKINMLVTQYNREMQIPINLVREIHPGRKYIMKERLHNVQQRRMATSKSGIKVAIFPLIFEKDIAKVSIPMTNHSPESLCRIKQHPCPLYQTPQRIA